MIALQVVRTSFGFHLRECMGSCFAPPPPPPDLSLFIIAELLRETGIRSSNIAFS